MKKGLCLFLSLLFVFFLVACDGTPNEQDTEKEQETTTLKEEETTLSEKEKRAKSEAYQDILIKVQNFADTAFEETYAHYWGESSKLGYLNNYPKESRTTLSDLGFPFAMYIEALETYYYATDDLEAKAQIEETMRGQMDTYVKKMDKTKVLGVGANTINPAMDDAAWSIMMFWTIYKITGMEKAREYCHDLTVATLDYFQDGDTSNGLWYLGKNENASTNFNSNDYNCKSLYCAGILTTGIEYYQTFKGTEYEDYDLYERIFNLYTYIETNFRRDTEKTWNGKVAKANNLYWCGFTQTATSFLPQGYDRGDNWIQPGHSSSSLFGNTAMCVVNKRLYDLTGEKIYLEKAVSTANAIAQYYNVDGMMMSDRDMWTNATFMGYFAREVLPLEGVKATLGLMLLKTAIGIMTYCHYDAGFYGPDWTGKTSFELNPAWIQCTGTTVHMLFATYLAMKNVDIAVSSFHYKWFSETYPTLHFDKTNYEK